MSDKSKSKWKVGSGRMYAHKTTDEIKALTTTYARKRVVKLAKEYKSLILKESASLLEEQKKDMQELILSQNNIGVQQKLMENQLHYNTMIMGILDELAVYEKNKKLPNKEILQWVVDKLIDMKKADAEIRKANEGQFEMRFGKKNINVSVKSDKSVEEWLNDSNKKVVDVEGEIIEEENEVNNGEKDTDNK